MKTLFMKRIIVFFSTALLLSACSGGGKKIVVMSKGPAEINTSAKTIKVSNNGSHEEKTVLINGDKVAIRISAPTGEATVELAENGLYIINAKTDTIIGSYQKYTDPKVAQQVISQESLKQKIDSLQLLSEGKNVSESNRNFYLFVCKEQKLFRFPHL